MDTLNLLALALIQGITEFLPISSSGHLILWPHLTGLPDQGLNLDIAVHVGTLFAVILYFWREVRAAAWGCLRLLRGRVDTDGAKLALLLMIATIPVVIAGLVIKLTGLNDVMRESVALIGWAMLGFGIVLWWADSRGGQTKQDADWTIRDAVIFGLWQMLALIPGTSRSGICITGARLLGYDRETAARLSMLMSIPTIIASGAILSKDMVDQGARVAGPELVAAGFAFVAALLALALMMRLLKSVSFMPYVIYRVVLGALLIVYAPNFV